MSEFQEILFNTRFTTSEIVKKLESELSPEEIDAILSAKEKQAMLLREKYKEAQVSDVEIMKRELMDYMKVIIGLINSEYSDFIPKDRLDKLNQMLSVDSIDVINDESYKHDISADSRNGKIIVNLARIGKNEKGEIVDIYSQVAAALGSLPHELFHIVIRMLKPDEIADERMVVNTKNGVATTRGMVGCMLNEGFVEKFSSSLCQKYGLYCQPVVSYLHYVELCDYVMKRFPQINEKTIFSLDESDIIPLFSLEEQQMYYEAERLSYAVRSMRIKREDILSTSMEMVDIDFKGISKDSMEEIKNYYLMKNSKLEEMMILMEQNRHL